MWAVCTIQIGDADFERLNLSYDLRVPYWHPYEAADAIGPHYSLPVALNHTGFPWDGSKSGIISWEKALATIAACPNGFVKLSELGLKNSQWATDSNRGVVLDTIEIFGVERCIWASDFPVARLRVSYKNQLGGILAIMNDLSGSEVHQGFNKNAMNFYKINLP